ncbi:hypothetical protein [Methanoculleus caldifontis]|nr:hypothetical protein [Methanoculleus sp. Wushi-C6]
MEAFTVEEVIGYQIEIIRASGVEKDRHLRAGREIAGCGRHVR